MRLLGIDYGTKRVGIAISDESAFIAREFSVLSPKEFLKRIPKLVDEQEIGKLVVGLPLNMQGKHSKKTEEVVSFISELEKILNIPIVSSDERLSTVMAHRLPGGRAKTDSLAAQIILQNYLDSERNKNNE